MDEMNPLPEEQNNEELKEQEIPAPESTVADEPDVKIPSHKAPKPKLPLIIGGIFTAIAALTVVLVIVFSNGSHEHSFGAWTAVEEPTCLATGTEERTCECGVKESRPVGVLSHTEVITPAVNATCTQKGLTEGKHCSVCGTVIVAQTEIPMNTHSFDDEYDSDCNICGYVRDVECAHSETEIVPGCAATCTETGLTDGEKCKKCGEIIVSQSIIPVKAHTEVIDAAVEASCTQTGLTEGKHCSVCGAVIVAQTVIPALGHDFVDDACSVCDLRISEGLKYNLSSDGTYYTVSGIGTCTDTDIVIPSTYNDLPVASIGSSAFYNCTSLTSITIPDSVTSIGGAAFYCCSSLTSVTIPDSVTSIGNGAFMYCESLTSVTIGDSVTSIGDRAFYNCTSLTSVTIGDSVTSIGSEAFYYCSSLQYNEYGNALYLGNENNPYHALIKAKSTSVTSCEIHSNTKLIAGSAFSYCTSLTSVTIPDSVTSIGSSAFSYCDSLTSITIPDSVTSIGNYAFRGCTSLTSIEVNENNNYYKSNDENLYSKDGATLIQYAIGKPNTSFTIPDSVTDIGDGAFYKCTSLTSITIPDSVTSIGRYAFSDCKSLTSVTIGDSVTSIGYSAFSDCDSLTSVTIPDSVTSIGEWAFSYCTSLTSVTIPDSVTSIGEYAFSNCTSLTSVTIGDSVTSIGDRAFSGCTSLTSVNFGGTVSQWKAMSKGRNWNTSTGTYTIYCTDGEITKSGTVTYY